MLWFYPIPIKGIGQVLIVRVKMGEHKNIEAIFYVSAGSWKSERNILLTFLWVRRIRSVKKLMTGEKKE